MRKITFLTMTAIIGVFGLYSCNNDDEGNVPESESLKFDAAILYRQCELDNC